MLKTLSSLDYVKSLYLCELLNNYWYNGPHVGCVCPTRQAYKFYLSTESINGQKRNKITKNLPIMVLTLGPNDLQGPYRNNIVNNSSIFKILVGNIVCASTQASSYSIFKAKSPKMTKVHKTPNNWLVTVHLLGQMTSKAFIGLTSLTIDLLLKILVWHMVCASTSAS